MECDHKEADTRIIVSAVKSDWDCSVIVCNDTDVMVALLSNYQHMNSKDVYLQRSKKEYVEIKSIAEGLLSKGISLNSLPLFDALSGSDTTSFLYSIGKPNTWKAYKLYHVSM